jgi:class 3 adenylate cyclase
MKIGPDRLSVKYSFEKYYSFLDEILKEHGSDDITRAGDGSMSSYYNTQDAVNAALVFLKKLDKFNREQNKLPLPFQPRCGIHCGDVPGNVQIPNIFSIVLDIAGHLQKYCDPGGLLISDTAYQEISNKDDFEKLPRDVDGQQVWRHKIAQSRAMIPNS